MTRIGKQPISIEDGVKVLYDKPLITVSGTKGNLDFKVSSLLDIDIDESAKSIVVKPKAADKQTRSMHGTVRSQIANMIHGVSKGFEKVLQYKGVGFKAQVSGAKLVLNLGFSHPIEIEAPEGIQFSTEKDKIKIAGHDKRLVGEVAAQIRRLYPPEPYKGKGIAYLGEKIKRKQGKTVAQAGDK
jgi:large subunit ribosomal protein L6